MTTYLADNPGQGFGLLYEAFRAKGSWGKTRLWGVYCALNMNLSRRGKRRLATVVRLITSGRRTDHQRPLEMIGLIS